MGFLTLFLCGNDHFSNTSLNKKRHFISPRTKGDKNIFSHVRHFACKNFHTNTLMFLLVSQSAGKWTRTPYQVFLGAGFRGKSLAKIEHFFKEKFWAKSATSQCHGLKRALRPLCSQTCVSFDICRKIMPHCEFTCDAYPCMISCKAFFKTIVHFYGTGFSGTHTQPLTPQSPKFYNHHEFVFRWSLISNKDTSQAKLCNEFACSPLRCKWTDNHA